MGGKTAINFAMKWPELIEGLLIVDISPFKAANFRSDEYYQSKNILETILETDVSATSSRNHIEMLLTEKITSAKVRGLIMKNLQRTADNNFIWKINASALLSNLEKIMEGIPRPAEDYYCITGFPVIFLKGEKSDYLPYSGWNDILKIFPAAELKVIKNAGHWLHTDNPGAVTKALLNLRD